MKIMRELELNGLNESSKGEAREGELLMVRNFGILTSASSPQL
jgi:hypothetical protein